jgi:hypothetical protein
MAARAESFWSQDPSISESGRRESLCDGCGLCCLQKLEDDYTRRIYYTNVACKLLDLQTCQCSNYARRQEFVPDCIALTPGDADAYRWLPETCAYRLVAQGDELPPWHHLVCATRRGASCRHLARGHDAARSRRARGSMGRTHHLRIG